MFCPNCGAQVQSNNQRFCVSCGSGLQQTNDMSVPNSNVSDLVHPITNQKNKPTNILPLIVCVASIFLYSFSTLYIFDWISGSIESIRDYFSEFFRFAILPGVLIVLSTIFLKSKPILTVIFGVASGLVPLLLLLWLYAGFEDNQLSEILSGLNYTFNPFLSGLYLSSRFEAFVNLVKFFASPAMLVVAGVLERKNFNAN